MVGCVSTEINGRPRSCRRASAALVLAICMRLNKLSCMRAPPEAAKQTKGRPRSMQVLTARTNFSPTTLNNDAAVRDWIDMFTMWPTKPTPGLMAQIEIAPATSRLSVYRSIGVPVLVIGFADDLLLPPYLGREVADAIPGARFLQIPDTGHLGFIERPDAVNAALLEFFGSGV